MATKKKLGRILSLVLAIVMMLSIVPMSIFAADSVDPTDVELKNGKVAISNDMNDDQIKKVLFDNLVANPDGKNYQDYEWQYYCEGKNTEVYKYWAWASIYGEIQYAKPPGIIWEEDYHFPALKNNGDRDWQVRLVGGTQEATLTKVSGCTVTFDYAASQGKITINGAAPGDTNLKYSAAASVRVVVTPEAGYNISSFTVNGKEVEAKEPGVYEFVPVADTNVKVLFSEVEGAFVTVTPKLPEGVTAKLNTWDFNGDFRVNNTQETTIEFATDANTSIDKVLVNGEDVTKDVDFANYNGTYKAVFAQDATIEVQTVKPAVALTGETVIPVITDASGNWDYKQIEKGVIDTLIADGTIPASWKYEEIEVTYDCQPYASDWYVPLDHSADSVGNDWSFWQLFYYTGTGVNPTPKQAKIRLQFKGNAQYRPSEYVYQTITIKDLPGAVIAVRSGVQNFTLTESAPGTYNYEALRQAIYKAVIDEANSTPAGAVAYDKIKMTYKILDAMGSSVGIGAGNFYDFEQGWLGADAAGTYRYMYKGGNFTIRVELPATNEYYGTAVEFDVHVDVKDIEAANIALKDNYAKDFELVKNYDRSFDTAAFEDALYNAVIDEAASTPAGAVTRENIRFIYDITTTGTHTVKAVIDGTDTYRGSEKEFTVNVKVVDNFAADIIYDAPGAPTDPNPDKYVHIPFHVKADHTFDYARLKADMLAKVVTEIKNVPEYSVDDFVFEYDIMRGVGTDWADFEYSSNLNYDLADCEAGGYNFKITLKDKEGVYYGDSIEFCAVLDKVDLPKVSITAKDNATVTLNINKDRSYDYAGLKQAMLDQILTVTGLPEGKTLTEKDLHFMYVIYDDHAAIKDYIEFEERKHAGDANEILYHYLHQGGNFQFWAELPNGDGYYGNEVYFKANVVIEDTYTTKIGLKDNYERNFTLYYKDANSFDYDRLKKDIFNAVIDTNTSSSNVTFENMIFSYDVTDGMAIHYPDAPFETVGSDYADPAETLFTYLHDGGSFDVKLAVPTSAGLFGNSVTVRLNIGPFGRVKSSIVLNGNAKLDYTSDVNAVKQYIFDEIISKELSVLPADVTVNDFTFEYWAQNYTAGGVPGVEKRWVPFEGMKHPTLAGSYFLPIGAGDNYFRVMYNGNTEYEPTGWTSGWDIISLPKADFTFNLKQDYIYKGDQLPRDFIQVSENAQQADINYRMLFTTTTNEGNALVYLQTRDGYAETDFTLWMNPVITDVFGADWTALWVLQNGLTIDQYKQLINSQRLYEHFNYWYGMNEADMAVFREAALSRLGGMNHVTFRLGTPAHAAHYDLFVGAYNPSFNTEVMHTGMYVKYNSKGAKLQWRESATGLNTINSKSFDFGADATKNGISQSDGNVKYLYTGLFYCSSQPPRGKTGFFIQTAWTKAGTMYCFPITRSFTISVL